MWATVLVRVQSSTPFFYLKNGVPQLPYAGVAELADAPDSKSGDGNIVWVRAPPPVPFNQLINYPSLDIRKGEGIMSTSLANILLLVVFIVMIYFMMIRPQRKKDKEDREMRASLAVGDEVITIGGIIGKVTKISEKSVVVETGAGKNKIEFLKTAIASVSKSDAAKAEAKKEAPKEEAEEEKKPDRDKKVTPKKLTKKSDSEETK